MLLYTHPCCDSRSKQPTCSTGTNSPCLNLLRVTPHKIAESTFMGNFTIAINRARTTRPPPWPPNSYARTPMPPPRLPNNCTRTPDLASTSCRRRRHPQRLRHRGRRLALYLNLGPRWHLRTMAARLTASPSRGSRRRPCLGPDLGPRRPIVPILTPEVHTATHIQTSAQCTGTARPATL
jgi:hypothetical protein